MACPDDVRTITRIVKVWRVCGFMASHADGTGDFEGDEAFLTRIGCVLAARAVTHLALHVLAPLPVPLESGAAHSGAVDAADASRLLPARHVAADTIEAELLLHVDERLVR